MLGRNEYLSILVGFMLAFLVSLHVSAQENTQLDQLKREADYYAHQDNFPRAIDATERLLQVTQVQFGEKSRETAEVVGVLGLFHKYAGHYQQAEQMYRRELDILKSLPENGGREYITALSNLGMLYRDADRLDEAQPLLEEALTLGKQQFADDPNLAFFYNNLGLLYLSLNKYDKAEPFLKAALNIREASPGIDKDLLAISYDNLGNLYLSMDRLRESEANLLKALPLFRETLGATNSDTLICLENLSDLYTRTNRQEKAIDLLSTALNTSAGNTRGNDPGLIEVLRRRGDAYLDGHRYLEAEADFQEALAIADANGEKNDPRVTKTLLALGGLYKQTLENEKGDSVLERAQKMEEDLPKPDHESLSMIYSRRGWFQMRLQNWQAAEKFLQKALDMETQTGGLDSLSRAIALNNLASAQAQAGKLEQAETNTKQAMTINDKRAPHSVDLAENYNLMGAIQERRGQTGSAENSYRSSVQLFTDLLGANHPKTINAETNLGLLLMNLGKSEEASALAKRRATAFENGLLDLLASGTEAQALAFVRAQNPFVFFGTLGLPEPMARAVINYKGAVTDAMFERRNGPAGPITAERKEALEKWRRARRQLTEWMLQESTRGQASLHASKLSESDHPSDLRKWQAKRDELTSELAHAEADLARLNDGVRPVRGRFNISVADIQISIPADAVLLDYVRYSHYLGKAQSEDRYGVIILTRGQPAQWVPLGKAWDIEQATAAFQRVILGSDPVNKIPGVLSWVYDLVVSPFLSKLPEGTKRLLISPDGELNFLSFGTLLGADKRFLAEQYSITYLANARALLNRGKTPPDQQVLIYANPRFRLKPESHASDESVGFDKSFQFPVLEPLPFTMKEAQSLQQIAAKNGWHVTIREGFQATEEGLNNVNKPGILHLATHGFYLPQYGTELVPKEGTTRGAGGIRHLPGGAETQTKPREKPEMTEVEAYQKGLITSVKTIGATDVALDDPMLRSGIAMVGAQDTLENWRHGKVLPTDKDGVLNAQEAAALDLQGTWIVTLSSCNSGLGEAEPGEGIFGLRRALLEAGTQNLLTTLWPVSDALTPSIMAAFYEQAFATHDAPAALADVQLRFLVKLRKERGLEEAVRLAGAFVMTSQVPVTH